MAHLKHIKRRLTSVRTTHKMVTAMKLVAGARFRQSQNPLKHAVMYEEGYRRVLRHVAHEIEAHHEAAFYFERAGYHPEDNQKDLVLVITSDRGLCGSFHQQIARAAIQHIHRQGPSTVQLMYWGAKGRILVQRHFPEHTVPWQFELTESTAETPARQLSRLIFKAYKEHMYRRVWIVYGQFISGLSQKPCVQLCLPLSLDHLLSSESMSVSEALYDFEPEAERMASILVQRYVEALLHRMLSESTLAEHAARMMAMDSASRNAEKLSQHLALMYNRTRQALITKELIEIIVGAETLSS